VINGTNSNQQLHEYAIEYESATKRFEKLVASVSEGDLDVKHADGWSARQSRVTTRQLGRMIRHLDMKNWTSRIQSQCFPRCEPRLLI
jgi:hypothetical protein